jgi:hypothetical protein
MMKASVYFDIPRKRGIQGASMRRDPVEDGAFEALRVVRPGAGSTLLNLGNNEYRLLKSQIKWRTNSAIAMTLSSEPSIRRSSRPGTN